MAVSRIVSGKGGAFFTWTFCLWASCLSWLGAHPLSQSYLLLNGDESEVRFRWLVDLEEVAGLPGFPTATFHEGGKEQGLFTAALSRSLSSHVTLAVGGDPVAFEPSGWKVTDDGFLELSFRCPRAGSTDVLEVSHSLQNLFGHPHQLVVHSGKSPGSSEYVIPPHSEGMRPVRILTRAQGEARLVGQMLGDGLLHLAPHLDLVLMLVAASLFLGLSPLRLAGVTGSMLLLLAGAWWLGRFPEVEWVEFIAPLGLAYLSVEFLLWGRSRSFFFGATAVAWLIVEFVHAGYLLIGVCGGGQGGDPAFWPTVGLLLVSQLVGWGIVAAALSRAPARVRPRIERGVSILLTVVGGCCAVAVLIR